MTKPKSKPKTAIRSATRKSAKTAPRKRPHLYRPRRQRARHQARSHHRDAADPRRRNDCCHHDRYRLAATFRARISRWRCPQKTRTRFGFGADGQGPRLPHQGWKGCTCCGEPGQTGGLMRCRSNVAIVSRPKLPLRTRSRICAVSISKDFVHDGRAYFKDRPPIICRGICCSQSSPIGFKPTALAT